MTVRFLVVGSQRSGTTVTQAVLRGHAEVSIPMEETRAELLTDGYRACTFGRESYASRCRMNGRLFEALAGCLADERTRAMGLKVALDRADVTARLVLALREYHPGLRVIHVVREDLLAQFASLERARHTGVWHVRGPEDAGAAVRLELEIGRFVDYARDALSSRALLRTLQSDRPCHELVFERAFGGDGGFDAASLFALLGVVGEGAGTGNMRKVAPPVEEFVTNVPELREAVVGIEEPSGGEVEELLLRVLAEDAGTELVPGNLLARAGRWEELGWIEARDVFLAEAVRRLAADGAGFEPRDRLRLALCAAAAGPELAAQVQEPAFGALAGALHVEEGRDAVFAAYPLSAGERILAARDAAARGLDRVAESLAASVLAKDPAEVAVLEGACGLLEVLWGRLGDVRLAQQRLADWEGGYAGVPCFELLAGLVARRTGAVDVARARFRRAAAADGDSGARAVGLLDELDD